MKVTGLHVFLPSVLLLPVLPTSFTLLRLSSSVMMFGTKDEAKHERKEEGKKSRKMSTQETGNERNCSHLMKNKVQPMIL